MTAPCEKRCGGGITASTTIIFASSLLLLLFVLTGTTILAETSPTPTSSSSDEDDTCGTENDVNYGSDHDGVDGEGGISTISTTTSSLPSTMTVDFHPKDRRLLLYHFETTTSTQDEAKIIAESLSSPPPTTTTTPLGTMSQNDDDNNIDDAKGNVVQTFCVTATIQSTGRGTSGRQWMGTPGNVFATIGIPMKTWMGLKDNESHGKTIPLTLLPLRIGDLVATTIQTVLDDECGTTTVTQQQQEEVEDRGPPPPMVTVKWPNDVLVDDKKISGTLIESAHGWFLIGIGINLAHAPHIPTSGPDHGRLAVSIRDYCNDKRTVSSSTKARTVGVQLAYDLHVWLNNGPSFSDLSTSAIGTSVVDNVSAKSIIDGWKRWLDWDMEWTIRDKADRERVRIVDVLSDGRIQVANIDDGSQRILVSDYFF